MVNLNTQIKTLTLERNELREQLSAAKSNQGLSEESS